MDGTFCDVKVARRDSGSVLVSCSAGALRRLAGSVWVGSAGSVANAEKSSRGPISAPEGLEIGAGAKARMSVSVPRPHSAAATSAAAKDFDRVWEPFCKDGMSRVVPDTVDIGFVFNLIEFVLSLSVFGFGLTCIVGNICSMELDSAKFLSDSIAMEALANRSLGLKAVALANHESKPPGRETPSSPARLDAVSQGPAIMIEITA